MNMSYRGDTVCTSIRPRAPLPRRVGTKLFKPKEKLKPEERPKKRKKGPKLKVSNLVLGPLRDWTRLCIDSWENLLKG